MSGSFEDALRSRCQPWGLSVPADQEGRLARYYALLDRWNARINLTSLPLTAFPSESVDRLLIEPLIAAREVPDSAGIWLDFGTGGGSPAIPLKVLRPAWDLTMVETRQRKTAFLREAVRQLGLNDAHVLEYRIEELPGVLDSSVDLVTARAIQPAPAILSVAARLLRRGGKLLAFGWQLEAIDGFNMTSEVPLPGSSRLRTFVRT